VSHCDFDPSDRRHDHGGLTRVSNLSRFIPLLSIYPPCGPGEAPGTYPPPSVAFLHHSVPHLRAFSMSLPNLPALQRLHRLNVSSSGFCDRLSNALYEEEYQQCVPDLQGDDLVWLVDYLDKVPRYVISPHPSLKPA